MKKVQNNHLVSINYIVKDRESGEVLDASKDSPFRFILGRSQVIGGLEAALIGKKVGEKFSATIAPEDAYGVKNLDFFQEIPKEQFAGIDLIEGMTLFGQSENGETIQAIVHKIQKDTVIIDYNHPLAGKTLLFDVEILDSAEPSEDEILEASGCCGGGHHGGCCGAHKHEGDHHCGCGH